MQQKTSPRCAVPAPSQPLPYHIIQTDNLERDEAGISVGQRCVDHWSKGSLCQVMHFSIVAQRAGPDGRIGAACCFDISAVILEFFKGVERLQEAGSQM